MYPMPRNLMTKPKPIVGVKELHIIRKQTIEKTLSSFDSLVRICIRYYPTSADK